MFPVSKLERLPPRTALRKVVLILQKMETELAHGKELLSAGVTLPYLFSIRHFLTTSPFASRFVHDLPDFDQEPETPAVLRRALNRTRHLLLRFLGAEPAEWDLLEAGSGALDAAVRRVFPIQVYLEEIRSPFNVGSMIRTAEAFGVTRILLSALTAAIDHPRAQRTARGADKVIPCTAGDLTSINEAGPVFALETGGQDVNSFSFPARGTVLIGSEELGLSPEALKTADESLGRVSIPMAGAKRSLNVAVACGILLQAWFSFLDNPSENESRARKEI